NGFIGCHLVDQLLLQGHSVRVLDRYPSRFREAPKEVESLSGDLGNHGEVAAAVEGIDWVFHLAYTTVPQTSNEDPIYDIKSNLEDSVQLFQACRNSNVKKVVFISSGGTIYGVPKAIPIPEDHTTEPICSYGITKLAIEKYLYLFYSQWGQDYAVLRFSNPYGVLQNPHAKQGAIGVFLGAVAENKPISIFGDGEVVRDYVYVTDAAKALILAAEYQAGRNDPRVFNIGAGRGYSLNEIVAEIKKNIDRPVNVNYTPARAVDVPANVLDIKLAQKHLNWTPEIELAAGLRQTWEWITSLNPA
ncbi:MAG TPA: NAD-dependent epimerase/dehydratase family protein, partial [Candidatus Obscuribacterales bacterium]|nr:NAD-dependent epimerase/dehydratase family protein [Candidatus Obscuribacterales bacterium]